VRRYAVITTHDRPRDFVDCYVAIQPQVDHVVVVSHRADYIDSGLGTDICTVLDYDVEVPNISTMWNMGLDEVLRLEPAGRHRVAILNDDAIVPADWFSRVSEGMSRRNAMAGCSAHPPDLRMAGYAFILDSRAGLRLDEQFQWWYGDTDLERRAAPVAFVDAPVEHRHPNSTTVGVLADVAAADARRYERKWA
jgi:hypothetical protein